MSSGLSIVTVSYESSFVLSEFFQGLDVSDDVEVIVVDSGSSDVDATREIASNFGAHILPVPDNIGYGQGSNRGVDAASSAWVALVNPDVQIPCAELLRLRDEAIRMGLTCIGPTLRSFSGQAPPSARDIIRRPWDRSRTFELDEGLVYAPSMSGCCMVIRRDAFIEVGGFDQRFFMFCEEIDFHKRLAASGGKIAVSTTLFASTAGSSSSAGVTSRWATTQRAASHVVYMRKHHPGPAAWIDLAWRVLMLVTKSEFRPRRASLAQFFKALSMSKKLVT